jgi:epoxide hydrolase-like predicted phosphatase
VNKIIKIFIPVFVLALFIAGGMWVHQIIQKDVKITMIIFDFGGVIAQTDKQQILKFISEKLNLDQEQSKQLCDAYIKAKKNGKGEKEVWKHFEKEHHILLPKNWQEQMDAVIESAITPDQEMLALVEELKVMGYRVGLLSNTQKEKSKLLRKLGYYDPFDPVVLSCDYGIKKPDQEIYLQFLKVAKVEPEACLFIDDKVINVESARATGMQSILFVSPYLLKQALKGYHINVKE